MSAEENRALIERLYGAFGECNGAAMTACYARDAHFRDPAFGDLEGDDVGAMWRMLTGRANDIRAKFRFADGLIADHIDEFDFRRWAKQALGPSGNLVALLPPLRAKARAKALDQLAVYKREETGSSI